MWHREDVQKEDERFVSLIDGGVLPRSDLLPTASRLARNRGECRALKRQTPTPFARDLSSIPRRPIERQRRIVDDPEARLDNRDFLGRIGIQRLDVDKELPAASWRDRPEHLARLLADVSPAVLDMRRQNDHRSRRGIELVVPASNAAEPADDPEKPPFPACACGVPGLARAA